MNENVSDDVSMENQPELDENMPDDIILEHHLGMNESEPNDENIGLRSDSNENMPKDINMDVQSEFSGNMPDGIVLEHQSGLNESEPNEANIVIQSESNENMLEDVDMEVQSKLNEYRRNDSEELLVFEVTVSQNAERKRTVQISGDNAMVSAKRLRRQSPAASKPSQRTTQLISALPMTPKKYRIPKRKPEETASSLTLNTFG